MSEAIIEIKDKDKFIGPLDSLSNSINSIAFCIEDNTLRINAMSEDRTQKVNIWYKSDIVEVSKVNNLEKFGIYNLSEFIGLFKLTNETPIKLKIKDNKLLMGISKNSKINYILTDLDLITEGPAETKKQIDFNIVFEVDDKFISKIKNVSKTLNTNILKFQVTKNKLIYKITDKLDQHHVYTEILLNDCDSNDFDISIPLKDDNRDNVSILKDTLSYEISLHPKIVQMQAITEDYEKIRYYLAPLDNS